MATGKKIFKKPKSTDVYLFNVVKFLFFVNIIFEIVEFKAKGGGAEGSPQI
jgi:hypothetical protein